jgi:YspA, cpYpsA-related SLOG family
VKILCTGSRHWKRVGVVNNVLKGVIAKHGDPANILIIHGACRGADTIVDRCARKLGFQVKAYPAAWDQYGDGAGPMRNRQMLDENPDVEFIIAFHDDIENSAGTKHMCSYALIKGKKAFIVDSSGNTAPFHYYSREAFRHRNRGPGGHFIAAPRE